MLSLANVYELGVTLSNLLFIGGDMGGDVVLVELLIRAAGLAGTGGGSFEYDLDDFRGIEVKSGSFGVGWWMCSGI